MGHENPMVNKDFQVLTSAQTVVVEFTLYQIDGGSRNDHFYVTIQGSKQQVQLFNGHSGSWVDQGVTGSTGKAAKYNIGFDADTVDFKTTVRLEIGYRWYTSGILELGFEADIADSITTRAVGIDDFKMSIVCNNRRMETAELNEVSEVTVPGADEPSEDGGDGSFYCTAEDFPCKKASGMVNVCHYSSKRGYQTFCVPEADSEILRFYGDDYCGPCVGGYGGVNIAQAV